MFPRVITETLIEIEDLRKQLSTWKKISGNLKEEIKLFRKLQSFIRKKNKEILARLKELGRIPSSDSDLKNIILPLSEATEGYTEVIIENTQEAILRGMQKTVNQLKKAGVKARKKPFIPKPKLEFDFIKDYSVFISTHIKDKIFEASERTMSRLVGNVMDNLRESYEQGYGYDKAAQELKDVFVDMETYELERVARTEIASSENLGMYETEKELGVDYHQWKTARDSRVRGNDPKDTADHTILEGQIVRVGEPFSNGLLYPVDRSGDIEEWIQCRCVAMIYLMPEGYSAPDMPYFYEEDLIRVVGQSSERG